MELVFILLLWLVIAGVVCAICYGICYGIFICVEAILGKNILGNIIALPFELIGFIAGIAFLILTILIPLAIIVKVIQFFWNY